MWPIARSILSFATIIQGLGWLSQGYQSLAIPLQSLCWLCVRMDGLVLASAYCLIHVSMWVGTCTGQLMGFWNGWWSDRGFPSFVTATEGLLLQWDTIASTYHTLHSIWQSWVGMDKVSFPFPIPSHPIPSYCLFEASQYSHLTSSRAVSMSDQL